MAIQLFFNGTFIGMVCRSTRPHILIRMCTNHLLLALFVLDHYEAVAVQGSARSGCNQRRV